MLRGITLEVASGEFLTILGESGSGKTTLLRLIAGFEDLDSGEIWMGGERLDRIPAHRRQVNTVFQSYAIFPHLSVFENVAYGLRAKNAPKSEIPERVTKALAMVKMSEFAQAAPAKAERRAATARGAGTRAGESPAGAAARRTAFRAGRQSAKADASELKSLQREVGITFIFVTHDQEEAMALSDRVALLRAGLLEQVAPPREIYGEPATAYAAQFIGQTNLLRAEVRDGIASAGSIVWRTFGAAGAATYSLRPGMHSIWSELSRSRKSATWLRMRPLRVFVDASATQSFGGAMDLLEIECGANQQHSRAHRQSGRPQRRARIRIRRERCGPRARRRAGLAMYSRAYKTAVTIPPLLWVTVFLLVPVRYSFLLQLLVRFFRANDRAQLEFAELSAACAQSHLPAGAFSLDAHRGVGHGARAAAGLSAGLLLVVPRREAQGFALPTGDYSAVGQLPGARLRVEDNSRQRRRAERVSAISAHHAPARWNFFCTAPSP